MARLFIHRQSIFVNYWLTGLDRTFEALQKRVNEVSRKHFSHVLAKKAVGPQQQIAGVFAMIVDINTVDRLDKHKVRERVQNCAILRFAHGQRYVGVCKL